jgi:hypothetical protein
MSGLGAAIGALVFLGGGGIVAGALVLAVMAFHPAFKTFDAPRLGLLAAAGAFANLAANALSAFVYDVLRGTADQSVFAPMLLFPAVAAPVLWLARARVARVKVLSGVWALSGGAALVGATWLLGEVL